MSMAYSQCRCSEFTAATPNDAMAWCECGHTFTAHPWGTYCAGLIPEGGTKMTNSEARKRQESTVTDPRIQQFYDAAEALNMTPGEYAVHLLGIKAVLDPIEEARMEEAEEGQ